MFFKVMVCSHFKWCVFFSKVFFSKGGFFQEFLFSKGCPFCHRFFFVFFCQGFSFKFFFQRKEFFQGFFERFLCQENFNFKKGRISKKKGLS